MSRDEIMAANPIEDFVRGRGHVLKRAGQNFVTAGCPIAEHKKAGHRPVTLDTRKNLWHCNDCGKGGSVIDWVMQERGCTFAEAIQFLGGGTNGQVRRKIERNRTRPAPKPFDWQLCVDAFTEKDQERLAEWRGYPDRFVEWLHENALVGLYRGHVAFPVHDGGEVVAAHYRVESGKEKPKWFYFPLLSEIGLSVQPLVIGAMPGASVVHAFESQWDAFAACDKLGLHQKKGVALIVTRGAGNGELVEGLIRSRAKVFAWPQNDKPDEKGKVASEDWLKDIATYAGAAVQVVRTPEQFEDLNAWTWDGGATAADLQAAIKSAEVFHQKEKTWVEALNESVVTASELRELHLTPRRKLLGDWFCEGDLGFIFAFRGVGKTWLALAIAQALSTGGKLGEWQAQEEVKVLYVDGEMPPDLMRDRCEGLQASNANLEFLNHEILFDRTGKALNITNREVQQAITARCVNAGVKVLILDNLSTLASGMKENEADSWEMVNNWLLDLRRRKIAVVIVHHAGRSGEMRGTSKREDNVFWIIALDDARKDADNKRGARFVSRFTKPSRNTQEEVPAFEWHLVTDATTGLVSIGHKQAHTLDVFRNVIEAGVTKPIEIAKEMKLPDYAISRLAKKAIDAGWLKKAARGEYMLVEAQK